MTLDALPRLALIPAGEFLMGADEAEEDERPVHRVHVDDVLMGIQPVSNAEYARFVRETGHRAPSIYEMPLVINAGGFDRERDFRQTAGPYEWVASRPSADRLDHPVTLVRYDDAAAYCAWLAAVSGRAFRLPTEAEWEIAAVQASRRGFRWGEVREWTAGTLRPWAGFTPAAWSKTAELDAQPVFAIARVQRGASFASRARMKHPRARWWALPERDDGFVGFRTCAL